MSEIGCIDVESGEEEIRSYEHECDGNLVENLVFMLSHGALHPEFQRIMVF